MRGWLHKRSLSLSGHRTSVALEPEFWAALDRLAAHRGETLAVVVATLDRARESGQPLASVLRLQALRFVAGAGSQNEDERA